MKSYAKTQTELAALCNVSRRTILDWSKRPGFPRQKSKLGWSVEAVLAWRDAWASEGMAGPVSPALERYRAARAALAEHELAERQGKYVLVSDVAEWLTVYAGIMRDAFRELRRCHGEDAFKIVVDALDSSERECQRRMGRR